MKKPATPSAVEKVLGGDRRPLAWLAAALGLTVAAYHVLAALFGTPEALTHRVTHVSLFVALAFIYYPLGGGGFQAPLSWRRLVDLGLVGLTLANYLYIARDFDAFALRSATPDGMDLVSGTLLILLLLEATRRAVGGVMVLVPAAFFLHTWFSDHFPGVFLAAPTSFSRQVSYLTMELDGIYGIPVMVSATFIIMFILFGSVMIRSGAGDFFTDLSLVLAGRRPGGTAKAAVVSSGIYGSLTGSTTANVVTTGSFTIPLMIAGGFRPRFAASVEAIASNGGQFMPPIMGAAAFIMPFFIPGATYGDVCLAALLPALLYFLSLYTVVHLQARKLGMTGLPPEQLPHLWPTLKTGWPLAFSLATIVGLLVYGFTPMTVGVWATLVTFVVTLFRPETRLSPGGFMAALEVGVQRTIPIAIACAAAGIIIGAMNLSGLAARISSVILDVSNGQLWIALLLTMVVAILLGMGVTTAIVYITLVALVVPSLIDMGTHPMAANMFVFYFGALSGVTPPVCLTTYAAAGIAQSNPWQTGWLAARVGLASFIVPFMVAYTPELLFIGQWYYILLAFGTASLGVICLASVLQGWLLDPLAWWERALMAAAALMLIHPDLALGLAGAAAAGLVYGRQRLRRRGTQGLETKESKAA